MQLTNCHVHLFTHEHAPDRFVRWPLSRLLTIGLVRRLVLKVVLRFDRGKRGRIARLCEVLEISYGRSQEDIFKRARGFYPATTRFVVLPMDMELIGAGKVAKSIDDQHAELAELRDRYGDVVIPFAAVDPRRDDVVPKTIRLIEDRGFAGLKLYPPLGYHPNDPALHALYAYAEEHGVPVLTHCSRPAGVRFRGKLTDRMRTDPVTGGRLTGTLEQLLTIFTDPDAYVPIMEAHPRLKICLAHFGGAGDWTKFLDDQWLADSPKAPDKSWLAKIADMIRSGKYPNLWTDISYSAFADDENVYLLKVLLADDKILAHTLFGSDFYVVANAELEERRRAVRIRAVLGEDLFRIIAEDNPKRFLQRVAVPAEPEALTAPPPALPPD